VAISVSTQTGLFPLAKRGHLGGTAPFLILSDISNYVTKQMTYGPNDARSEFVSAFGTADAEPGSGTRPILLNNEPIAFRSYAPGGTAVVEALNLTPPEEVTMVYDGFYNLRFRALDCGGSANGSDVFAVFH